MKKKAYKGFDKDLKCRGFQYEPGKRYEHKGDIEICGSGFHACEYPLNVFDFYSPSNSRFAIVESSGDIMRGEDKICSSIISVEAEIDINTLVNNAVEYINDGLKRHHAHTGDYSAATNTGDYSAATNTGDDSAATNTGDYSAATNTGSRSAATNTGNRSAATNTGDESLASVEGKDSIALSSGCNSRAKASKGSWIVLAERDDNMEIITVKVAQAGVTRGIKSDVYYTLENGNFKEVG